MIVLKIERLHFPAIITGLFICIIYVLLTGGLHLDGLGDTADGIFSYRPKERILEIMKDSRVGTNAVLVIVLVVLGYIFFIAQVPLKACRLLLLMPVIGRMALPLAAGVEKYARPDGLGRHFIDFCGPKEIFIGVIISSILSFAILGLKGLLILILTGCFSLFMVKFFAKKIDGITGDILGAVCELAQLCYFILAYLFYLPA